MNQKTFETALAQVVTQEQLDNLLASYYSNGPRPLTPALQKAIQRVSGRQGQYGWVRYNLMAAPETIASGATKKFTTADVVSAYTETGLWQGTSLPTVDATTDEFFGPFIKSRYDAFRVQLNLGLDLDGVAVPVGIQAGIWEETTGAYWIQQVKSLDTGELTFFQAGRAGNRVQFAFDVVPYWTEEATTFEDLLKGMGIAFTNLAGVGIDITASDLTLIGY